MSFSTKKNLNYLSFGVLIVILLYGLGLYLLALPSSTFHFDDNDSIVNNAAIRTLDIPRIFNAFNTRFLVGFSFALNYKYAALDPFSYRFTNLFIHCLNAFLVYLLLKCTLYLNQARKPVFSCRLEWPAFFGSMLFLCHPLQTEPVNFITQRFVLMGTFFYLLTMVLYVRSSLTALKGVGAGLAPARSRFYFFAAMLSAVAAMFCKEFVITLPLMLVLYDFYFLEVIAAPVTLKSVKGQKVNPKQIQTVKEPIGKRCGRLIPFFFIAMIVPLLLLRTPPQAIGVANIAETNDITRANGSLGRGQYFLTELNVVCTYVRLLIVPVNQNFDYDYPLANGLDPKTALCGLFLFCLLGIAFITRKSNRIISFGILWFFIALSVESSIIPIGHVIAEYRAYLASVGFVFLVVNLIYLIPLNEKALHAIFAAILIGSSILTYQRTQVWRDEFTLWNDTIGNSPHKARPYNNRGSVYYKQGNFTQALSDYSKAVELNPNYADAYNNLGGIYFKQGNYSQALIDYNKTIELSPLYAEAYSNRGVILNKQGNFNQAIADFTKAIELKPDYEEAYNNRGNTYEKQGNLIQALADCNKALELNPHDIQAYSNRGLIYTQQGLVDQAIADFNKVIDMDPRNDEAYFNLGNILDKQGNFTQAIAEFNKAIKINPHFAEVYNNRGIVYAKQNNLTQAIPDFTRAIEINPQYPEAFANRGLADYQLNKYSQAISDYSQALEINPDYKNVYTSRAAAYYQLKEFDKAWRDVHKAQQLGITVSPDLINALNQVSPQ